jgi:hypothetical protein
MARKRKKKGGNKEGERRKEELRVKWNVKY